MAALPLLTLTSESSSVPDEMFSPVSLDDDSVDSESMHSADEELSTESESSPREDALPSDEQLLKDVKAVDMAQFSRYGNFFKLAMQERRSRLTEGEMKLFDEAQFDETLLVKNADLMIENCIGVCALPMGVVPVFLLNGKHFTVPMCVEEASVIAAASAASKLIAENGGFQGVSTGNIMIGQVQVVDFENQDMLTKAREIILQKKDELKEHANTFCKGSVQRGGGVVDVTVRIFPRKLWMIVHLHVNVCEAMGANIVNTVVEGVGPWISEATGGRVGLKILSNLCIDRRSKVCFKIPLNKMSWKGVEGRQVAERMMEAFEFAVIDPFRATTNNKGIMNGVDAVALATGQDWRAIEAGAHAYACQSGQYSPLANYKIDEENDCFIGSMEIPIAVGTKGGALSTHPTYNLSHQLLGNPDAQELSQIIVGIGLAQNFAAIRALAIEGIQKGHMALHAKNIAVSAGVPCERVSEVVEMMQQKKNITKSCAEECLVNLQIEPVVSSAFKVRAA